MVQHLVAAFYSIWNKFGGFHSFLGQYIEKTLRKNGQLDTTIHYFNQCNNIIKLKATFASTSGYLFHSEHSL